MRNAKTNGDRFSRSVASDCMATEKDERTGVVMVNVKISDNYPLVQIKDVFSV